MRGVFSRVDVKNGMMRPPTKPIKPATKIKPDSKPLVSAAGWLPSAMWNARWLHPSKNSATTAM